MNPRAAGAEAKVVQVAAMNGRTICHAAGQEYSTTANVAVSKGRKISILRQARNKAGN